MWFLQSDPIFLTNYKSVPLFPFSGKPLERAVHPLFPNSLHKFCHEATLTMNCPHSSKSALVDVIRYFYLAKYIMSFSFFILPDPPAAWNSANLYNIFDKQSSFCLKGTIFLVCSPHFCLLVLLLSLTS